MFATFGICMYNASVVAVVTTFPATPPLPRAFTLCSLLPKGSFTITCVVLHITSGGASCSEVAGFSQAAMPDTFAQSSWSKYRRFNCRDHVPFETLEGEPDGSEHSSTQTPPIYLQLKHNSNAPLDDSGNFTVTPSGESRYCSSEAEHVSLI